LIGQIIKFCSKKYQNFGSKTSEIGDVIVQIEFAVAVTVEKGVLDSLTDIISLQ